MKKTDYDNLTAPTRQRTSVAIQGLDTSTPDDIVADGACEKLHNLRFKNGAWRPINNFAKSRSINNPYGGAGVSVEIKKVFTRFPPLGEKTYICSAAISESNIGFTGYAAIDLSNGTYKWIVQTTPSDSANIRCFGNIVYIDDKAYLFDISRFSPIDSDYFYAFNRDSSDGKVVRMPEYFKIKGNISADLFDGGIIGNKWYRIKQKNTNKDILEILYGWKVIDDNSEVTLGWKMADRDSAGTPEDSIIPDSMNSKISGEFAYFTAFRMADGTTLNPSALNIYAPQKSWSEIYLNPVNEYIREEGGSAAGNGSDVGTTENIIMATHTTTIGKYRNKGFTSLASYYSPHILISLAGGAIPKHVQSVAVFCTRLYPSLKRDLKEIAYLTNVPINRIFNDVKLPEDPFFLYKEIPLSELSSNTEYDLEISYNELNSVISNKVYTPSIYNEISSAGDFDYNQRLHMFNTSQQIPKAQYLYNALKAEGENTNSLRSGLRLLSDGKSYVTWGSTRSANAFNTPFYEVLSFHDARVDNFLIHNYDDNKTYTYPASSALGNNISYYIAPPKGFIKYPTITPISDNTSILSPSYKYNNTIHEPNRIQVSAPNNPLSLPFELSYKVGTNTNKILALQASSMQIAEEKVGDLPLYVFTEEGIYALRAGSETVYAKTEFINFDKIVNPNTIAVDGAIIYVTDQGVHLLKGTTSTIISTPIHDEAGLMPAMLYSCKMMRSNQFREVIFFEGTNSTTKAYVYNLDTGYWSTRDISGMQISNDEIYTFDGTQIKIYNTTKETEQSSPSIEIKTRPIKLGNVEFKRLETIIPRMTMTENTIIILDAAQALSMKDEQWKALHSGIYSPPYNVMRRTPYSARYFRVRIYGTGSSTFSITNIDFEWYERFRRKMR